MVQGIMGATASRLKELKEREDKVEAMGGPERVQKQHDAGQLTARERLEVLFDPGSFRELDMFVHHRCTDFGMSQNYIAGDGVVTGHGMVNGRLVFAFVQDFTSMGGTVGEAHARKICKVMDIAMRCGAPLVCLNDSGGARIQEGIDSLSGYAAIMFRHSIASGVIPQISAIMGPTAGGAVYAPAMTDWVFMVEKTSHMFITGPEVVKTVTGEEISPGELGGARIHSSRSGVAHFSCQSDTHAIEMIKELLSYLPSSSREEPPVVDLGDDPNRIEPSLDTIIPDNPRQIYDMKAVIKAIVDNGQYIEPLRNYAQNIITCFARLDGSTVSIVASQPSYLAGCSALTLSNPKHFGPTCWAYALSRRLAILHGYALRILHFSFCAAFHTVCLHLYTSFLLENRPFPTGMSIVSLSVILSIRSRNGPCSFSTPAIIHRLFFLVAAKQSVYPSFQLIGANGFNHVSISSLVYCLCHRLSASVGTKQNNRDIRYLTEARTSLPTIYSGQHFINNDQVRRGLVQPPQPLGIISSNLNPKAGCYQSRNDIH